jgi:uncharacterized membrane protein
VLGVANFEQSDVEKNRVLGGLGYLIFFIPLIACPDSRFGKFCANQGLIAAIGMLVLRLAFWLLGLILGWIPILGWIVIGILATVCYIAYAIMIFYYTFLAVSKGDARPLPYIGNYVIIK